jgi:hypothetical protein
VAESILRRGFLGSCYFRAAARVIFRMDARSPERIVQIGLGFWASKTLLGAVVGIK